MVHPYPPLGVPMKQRNSPPILNQMDERMTRSRPLTIHHDRGKGRDTFWDQYFSFEMFKFGMFKYFLYEMNLQKLLMWIIQCKSKEWLNIKDSGWEYLIKKIYKQHPSILDNFVLSFMMITCVSMNAMCGCVMYELRFDLQLNQPQHRLTNMQHIFIRKNEWNYN